MLSLLHSATMFFNSSRTSTLRYRRCPPNCALGRLPSHQYKSLIPPTSLISARLPSEAEMTQIHSLFIFFISLSAVIWQTRNLARHATLARTELELRASTYSANSRKKLHYSRLVLRAGLPSAQLLGRNFVFCQGDVLEHLCVFYYNVWFPRTATPVPGPRTFCSGLIRPIPVRSQIRPRARSMPWSLEILRGICQPA